MNNLKVRREELNLTQKQVAELSGIGLRLYQYYEKDEKEPSVRTAQKIADVLGVTVGELYGITIKSTTSD